MINILEIINYYDQPAIGRKNPRYQHKNTLPVKILRFKQSQLSHGKTMITLLPRKLGVWLDIMFSFAV